MIYNIHAGHNPDGKIACGAVSILKESTEARNVKNEVIRQLRLLGHTVYDCTVDDGKSQADVLSKIVAKCNSHKVDLDVSIHFNCGANDTAGNDVTTGTEAYVYNKSSSVATNYAIQVVTSIANLGFRNRGVKVNPNLYFLKKTTAQAVLIECCFVDDADDVARYDVQSMASAIVYGLTSGQKIQNETVAVDPKAGDSNAETAVSSSSNNIYRVQVGAFTHKENAEKLKDELGKKGYKCFITKA